MSDKRTLLIRTAFELFYEHGIHAIGINEILRQSGIAKKTLYHHFNSKDELVAATVEYRDKIFYDWLNARLKAAKSGRAQIDEIFNALDDWFHDRVEQLLPFKGCFFINASAEFGDPNNPVHQRCQQHKQRITDLFFSIVRPLLKNKQQASKLAEALSLLKEGAIVMAHVQAIPDAAHKARQSARLLLGHYQE